MNLRTNPLRRSALVAAVALALAATAAGCDSLSAPSGQMTPATTGSIQAIGYYPGYDGCGGSYGGGYDNGGYYNSYCGEGRYYYGRGYCADPSYGDSPHDEGAWDCRSDPYRDHNRYRKACRYYEDCTQYPRCKD